MIVGVKGQNVEVKQAEMLVDSMFAHLFNVLVD